MKRLNTWVAIGFVFLVSACGSSSSTSVPQSTNPNSTSTTLTTPPAVTTDPRLPNEANAIPINLVDKVNYSGLSDIAGNVFPPLVGDPLVQLTLTTTGRTTTISGQYLVSFEDSQGFWAAEQNSFPGTGTYTPTSLDIIFADDALVTRVIGSLTGNSLSGTIYYRVRASTDLGTECKQVTVTCVPAGSSCNTTPPNTVTPCENYMATSNASVKQLGAFVQSSFSTWVTQN